MQGLSYSQRSCVIFAKLTYICPHLLIMDEPTNFLDLESVDSLINASNKYKGALLLVSHNRDFLRKCAKQYLSITPGQFNLYDTLKTAETATYTFINEMESGGKVGKDALTNNPGGATVHSSQKVDPAASSTAPSTASSTASAPLKVEIKKIPVVSPVPVAAVVEVSPQAPKDDVVDVVNNVVVVPESSEKKIEDKNVATAAPPANVDYIVGEKVLALWTDGRWYSAVVKNIQNGKYIVHYTEYGNTTALPVSSLRKKGNPANMTKPSTRSTNETNHNARRK